MRIILNQKFEVSKCALKIDSMKIEDFDILGLHTRLYCSLKEQPFGSNLGKVVCTIGCHVKMNVGINNPCLGNTKTGPIIRTKVEKT